MGRLWSLVRRDLVLAIRQGGGLGAAIGFVLAVLLIVPLAVGPDLNLLQRLAAGVMWLTLLLSVLLTAERIFAGDLEDGTVDLVVAEQVPLVVFVLAKTLAHWLMVSLPLALICPFLGLMLNVAPQQIGVLLLAMVMGSVSLSLLAAVGGAVAAGLKRAGLLITLLVLPLYVPVLVFGISATLGQFSPAGSTSALLVLAGLTLLTLISAPWAAAAALRAYLR